MAGSAVGAAPNGIGTDVCKILIYSHLTNYIFMENKGISPTVFLYFFIIDVSNTCHKNAFFFLKNI